MSRRSSSTVKLARVHAARYGTTLDRNGIPVLDDPRRANRLPRKCHDRMHLYADVSKRFVRHSPYTGDATFAVEKRCVHCGDRVVETTTE